MTSSKLVEFQKELNNELAVPEVLNTLLVTTFKGLSGDLAKQAMLDGMIRGFKFKDFLEKNVYAIPFKNRKLGTLEYSLVTSIDYARKIGMRSGVCGKSKPSYEEDDGKIISCTVTVNRKVDEHIGDYTATVYFSEYDKGERLWLSKPHTMIAKVAEMHALRMACPEELSQNYIEDEIQERKRVESVVVFDTDSFEKKLKGSKDLEDLKKNWVGLPVKVKKQLEELKDEIKMELVEVPESKPKTKTNV